MSATQSLARRYWIELAWSVWVAINVVATILVPAGTTVPFHFIWLSLAVVFGIRLWQLRTTLWALVAICIVSGFALVAALLRSNQGLDEAAEVPMMGGMFLAMVWFALRWKEATEDLARASAREHDFVRDASHQLRTPITVARGHVELIRDGGADPQTMEDDLRIVLGELDRLARISDRLLLLATADQVRAAAREPVSLNRLVGAAGHRWRTAANREWQLQIRARGSVVGDGERIESALDALIENAVKATGPGDRIGVELRAEGSFAVIEVSDSGIGIAPQDLDRIFDRFWRATQPAHRDAGGTGLGLAIVKTIAEAHGGVADAETNSDGGATFRIRLPGFAWTAWPMPTDDGIIRIRSRPASPSIGARATRSSRSPSA